MKRIVPFLTALVLIVLIAAGYLYAEKYIPTRETADMAEVYDAGGSRVAVFYRNELESVKGIRQNGQTYLPLSYVSEKLNSRFYWDSQEELLIYALPDQVVYADAETRGSSGAPVIIMEEGEPYLTLGLISNYTDLEILSYANEEVPRIMMDDSMDRSVVEVIRDGRVRLLGGVKSPIVTEAEKGDQLYLLQTMDTWSRVRTPDGYIGYIENRKLSEPMDTRRTVSYEVPVYENTSFDGKIVLGWHQVTSMSGNQTLSKVTANTKGLNVISPTWFSLTDNNGNYSSLASKSYVDEAHDMGLEVWALIDNFSKEVKSEVLLSSTAARKQLIDNLMADVDRFGLDGINLDFEGLKPEAGPHYIQFIRELSIPCRERDVILSVDNTVPTSYSRFYDRKEQGIVADYVIVMGYDEHYAGSEPGPVASLSHTKLGIEGTLKEVPKEKLIHAVPFYTRIWTEQGETTTSTAQGIADARSWIEENHVELVWQKDPGLYYGALEDEDGFHQVWMEEETSLGLKMDMIREHDLAGVACWKLGLEDQAAWDAISWE